MPIALQNSEEIARVVSGAKLIAEVVATGDEVGDAVAIHILKREKDRIFPGSEVGSIRREGTVAVPGVNFDKRERVTGDPVGTAVAVHVTHRHGQVEEASFRNVLGDQMTVAERSIAVAEDVAGAVIDIEVGKVEFSVVIDVDRRERH